MTRRILILQTLNKPHVFSANNALLTLARFLNPEKIQMVVATPRRGLLTEALSRHHIPVAQISGLASYKRHDAIWRLPWVSWAVARLARRARADLILANHAELGPFANIAAKLTGIPWVCMLRQADRSFRYYAKYRLHLSSGVAAVSQGAIRGYQRYLSSSGRDPNPTRVIPSGIPLPESANIVPSELRTRLGWKAHHRVVGMVGMRSVKRPELLINLLPRLPSQTRCLLVGSDDAIREQKLRDRARELAVADRIHILGRQEEMAPYYRSMDVFAHPSRSEGLPKTVLEAMSYGLPVIAFRVGGLPEAVVDGETGYLCSPGDSDEFGSRLSELLRSDEQSRRFGGQGRLRVEKRFSPAAMIQGFVDWFEQVLDNPTLSRN